MNVTFYRRQSSISLLSRCVLIPRNVSLKQRMFLSSSSSSNNNSFFKGLQQGIKNAMETTKGSIFNLMAKNMNEKEVKKFLSHWKDRLRDEDSPSSTSTTATTKLETSPQAPSQSDEVKTLHSITTTTTSPPPFVTTDRELYHPLLGELIVDYQYKKVYSTSIHALARTSVWKKQRILRPERAALIAEDKIRKGVGKSLPGVITLFEDIQTKEIGIVDGQHRVGALMILAQRGYWNEKEKNVLIEVFPTETEDDIAVLFRMINAAEPVRLIDMPDNDGGDEVENEETEVVDVKLADVKPVPSVSTSEQVAIESPSVPTKTEAPHIPELTLIQKESENHQETPSFPVSSNSTSVENTDSAAKIQLDEQTVSSAAVNSPESPSSTVSPSLPPSEKPAVPKTKLSSSEINQIITNTLESLKSQYPEMFKPTSRCKVPHLNIDALRDELFTSNFLFHYQITTEEELLSKLNAINQQLEEKYQLIQQDEQQYSLHFTKSFENAYSKAKKYQFYLGMDKQWIFQSYEERQTLRKSNAKEKSKSDNKNKKNE